MRQLAALVVLLVGIGAGWVALRSSEEPETVAHGTVVTVVDGDTLVVALDGRRERVRVLGIDAPEVRSCLAERSTAETRRLALGRRVELEGDSSQRSRDRFGRRLAYVRLPEGRDLGFELVSAGLARSFVVGRPFERLEAYRRAETAGRGRTPSIWAC